MSDTHDQYRGYRHPFIFGIHYNSGVGDYPRTMTELAMSQYSAELRQRPEWWNMYGDRDVREQWAGLARGRTWNVSTPSTSDEIELSEKQIQYILDELKGYAALCDHPSSCQVSCFERIWELSIPSVPESLISALVHFRHITPTHPWDSDGLCTPLIDPHLHCFVYNHTLVATSPSSLRTLPTPTGGDIYTISSRFALLPSNVSISSSAKATFTSYINNLHPQTHAPLYAELASLLTRFVPLFEHTLTDLHRNNPLPQRIRGACRYTVWDEPEEPEFSDDEEGWAEYERNMRHWVMHRPIHMPDVPKGGYPGGLEDRKHTVSLRGRTVQVVVEVEEIRLEPDGPSYAGSKWHVQGMRNERIVACGEYYTSIYNLTPTALQFRMAVTYPRGFTAGDTGATARTWGMRDGDPSHQYIGARTLCQGLGLCFPNLYQHRQTPCTLLDPTRPGGMTVVRFGLVDPEVAPVVGTCHVAPQQGAWIRDALEEALREKVPPELIELVMQELEKDGAVMKEEEAEERAGVLRMAREMFRAANNQYYFCIPFDIWSAPDFVH